MLVIITYDIENNKKRTKLHKKLQNFGPGVQYSVFEADVKVKEFEKLEKLLNSIKMEGNDTIRLYKLCEHCVKKIQLWGTGQVTQDKPYYIA